MRGTASWKEWQRHAVEEDSMLPQVEGSLQSKNHMAKHNNNKTFNNKKIKQILMFVFTRSFKEDLRWLI